MDKMRILDRTGDTTIEGTVDDDQALAYAEEVFRRQINNRQMAFSRPARATVENNERIFSFDPLAEENLWVRPISRPLIADFELLESLDDGRSRIRFTVGVMAGRIVTAFPDSYSWTQPPLRAQPRPGRRESPDACALSAAPLPSQPRAAQGLGSSQKAHRCDAIRKVRVRGGVQHRLLAVDWRRVSPLRAADGEPAPRRRHLDKLAPRSQSRRPPVLHSGQLAPPHAVTSGTWVQFRALSDHHDGS